MSDVTIQCIECGRSFAWTERDQRFYQERGWAPPKRCEGCRARKKSERESWWAKPLIRYSVLALGLSMALAFALWYLVSDALSAWLIAVTVVTVLMYVYDKAIAGSSWMRVPERVLLALAFAGGTLGALAAMQVARHKTIKESFRKKFGLVVCVQVAVIAAYLFVIRPRLTG